MNQCPIEEAAELETPHDAIIKGFREQIRMKAEMAGQFIDEAKRVKEQLPRVSNEKDLRSLLANPALRDALISAAGVSNKAQRHLSRDILDQEILDTFRSFFTGGEDFSEEILHRYLLTKGGTLNGSVNNLIGKKAEERFVGFIKDVLRDRDIELREPQESGQIKQIRWSNRLMLFNRKPRFIGKNIDFIVLDSSQEHQGERDLLETPKAFLVCGELKGGIDPAGGDERWKTAFTALIERITGQFKTIDFSCPPLFFVGAAIGKSMAEEIFGMLQSGTLAHAANLTKDEQVQDLADWIVSL